MDLRSTSNATAASIASTLITSALGSRKGSICESFDPPTPKPSAWQALTRLAVVRQLPDEGGTPNIQCPMHKFVFNADTSSIHEPCPRPSLENKTHAAAIASVRGINARLDCFIGQSASKRPSVGAFFGVQARCKVRSGNNAHQAASDEGVPNTTIAPWQCNAQTNSFEV